MRSAGSGERGSLGQFDKLLVVGLGLVLVIAVRAAAPMIGERLGMSSGGLGGAAATATPTRTAASETATPAGTAAPTTPTPAATPAAALPDPPWFRVSAGGSGANVRQAPNRSAPIVLELKDGAVVDNLVDQTTADGLTWQRIKEGTVEGWIAAELLAPQRE